MGPALPEAGSGQAAGKEKDSNSVKGTRIHVLFNDCVVLRTKKVIRIFTWCLFAFEEPVLLLCL